MLSSKERSVHTLLAATLINFLDVMCRYVEDEILNHLTTATTPATVNDLFIAQRSPRDRTAAGIHKSSVGGSMQEGRHAVGVRWSSW